MKCSNCGMVFNGNSDTCPLCGSSIGVQTPIKRFLLNELKLKGNVRLTLLQLNFYIIVNISLILLATNLIVDYHFVWSLIPILAFITFNYILKSLCYPHKVSRYIGRLYIIACAILIAMQYATFKGLWAFNYAVPVVSILMSIYIFINIFTKASLWTIVKLLSTNFAVAIVLIVLLFTGQTSGDMVTKSLIIVSCASSCLVLFNATYCFIKFYRR